MKDFSRVCSVCGTHEGDARIIRSNGVDYCRKCYQHRNNIKYSLPDKGEVTYDSQGNPICHICGEAHSKILTHVWQRHGVSALEYKIEFGLEVGKGIMSEESTALARQRVLEHPEVIEKNLLAKGAKTRYNKGHRGRTKDKVSLQTLNRWKDEGFMKRRDK